MAVSACSQSMRLHFSPPLALLTPISHPQRACPMSSVSPAMLHTRCTFPHADARQPSIFIAQGHAPSDRFQTPLVACARCRYSEISMSSLSPPGIVADSC